METTDVDSCSSTVGSGGWGSNSSNSATSDFLKAVQMQIIPRSDCQRVYAPRQIYPQQVCAQGGGDTCQGDSGGPLFCFHNGKAVAIGIVSFGPRSCDSSLPGMYNRICNHVGWMKREVGNAALASHSAANGCRIPRQNAGTSIVNVPSGTQVANDEVLPVGSVVSVACDQGYTAVHPGQQSSCTTVDTWLPALGYCRVSNSQQCLNPPQYHNAKVSDGENDIGQQRMIVCNEGFEMTGTAVIQCQTNLQCTEPGWCEKTCPETPQVQNGYIATGSSRLGSIRRVFCQEGHSLVGANTIACTSNGQWSQSGYCSRVVCNGLPEPVENAQISFSGLNSIGFQIKVNCNPGYLIEGEDRITCQNDGTWSQSGRCIAENPFDSPISFPDYQCLSTINSTIVG